MRANELGIRLYKVAMTWPLEPQGVARFAEGLDLILTIEEKRSLIETQVKEQLFDVAARPQVLGKKDEHGNWLFPAKGALEPTDIALSIGERLIQRSIGGEEIKAKIAELKRLKGNKPQSPEAFVRTPYFCAGCPHNSSTVVPEGAHAYAGIGCHYMAQWMDRSTEGFTHMGGEGANWIGEAPFSKRNHVFQNLGDGTYIHSGSLAIRAALAANVNITFKVLYNDAVAMTGGQQLDGEMTVSRLVKQLLAEGVERVVIVTDEPDKYAPGDDIPREVPVFHRRDIMTVQQDLSEIEGVTALVYDQTCAAEKRRRRKRGEFPDPDRRIFINPAVCEGCGDCGKKSNCVAVVPLETELGRKRQIDQSACNKDFSCTEGFCPSFVTLHGAKVKKSKGARRDSDLTPMLANLPEPPQPSLDKPYAMIVTGVGGTGVVTVSAVLGQAAYIEGKGFGGIDMTGLAQKGGAVACHMRVARSTEDIHAIRVGATIADVVIGGDLVVTASNKVLETMRPDETAVVVSSYEMTTGDFARKPSLTVPGATLSRAISDRVRKGPLYALDAHDYAVRLFGDSIASNMFLLGVAYQLGHVPIGAAAIEEAIALNGAAVDMNRDAFRFGRLAVHDRSTLDRVAGKGTPKPERAETLDEIVAFRAKHLESYQDAELAARYRAMIADILRLEKERTPGRSGLAMAVARGYHKLLGYKDEYEVARLFTDDDFQKQIDANFEGVRAIEFYLAPPLLSRFYKDKLTGHPRKIRLGRWMMPVFRLLARGKALRGTRWDLFGLTAERKLERQMIAGYERVLDEIRGTLSPATHATAVALAALPEDIKGFGHIKLANYKMAKQREEELLRALRNPEPVKVAAE